MNPAARSMDIADPPLNIVTRARDVNLAAGEAPAQVAEAPQVAPVVVAVSPLHLLPPQVTAFPSVPPSSVKTRPT